MGGALSAVAAGLLLLLASLGFVQAATTSPLSHYRSLLETIPERLEKQQLIGIPKSDPSLKRAWEAGLFDANSPAGARKKIPDPHGLIPEIYDLRQPGDTVIFLNGSFSSEFNGMFSSQKTDRHLQVNNCAAVSVPANGISWTGGNPSSSSGTPWVLNCKAGHYRASGSFTCSLGQSCGNTLYNSCCSKPCCSTSKRDNDGDRGDDIRTTCTSYCCSACYKYQCVSAYNVVKMVNGNCASCSIPQDPYANNPVQSTGTATYSWSCRGGAFGASVSRSCSTTDGSWSGSASACRLCSIPTVANAINPSISLGTSTYSWSCMAGYYGSPVSRTCSSSDGSWSGSPITCQQCVAPSSSSTYSATSLGAGTFRYSCNAGYVGNSVTRVCSTSTGSWSGSPPTCVPAGVGYWSPGGTATRTQCQAGTYAAPSDTTLTTAACSGQCAAGYYCPLGSTSPYQNKCGSIGAFCPPGSAAPMQASATGVYTTPLSSPVDVRTGVANCPADRSCSGGAINPPIAMASGCSDASALENVKSYTLGCSTGVNCAPFVTFTNTGCTSSAANCAMTAKVTFTALTAGCSVAPTVTMNWVTSSMTYVNGAYTLAGGIQTGPNFLYGDRCTAGYRVTVTATRNSDATLMKQCTFDLGLIEVNEAPVMDKSATTGCAAVRSIDERSPIGKVVTGPVIKATDVNRGQVVMFSIQQIAGQPAPPFQIGLCDGVISVKDAVIDYSLYSSYTFNVVAKDSASSNPLTDVCQVTVKVIDYNDAPYLTNKALQVAENVPLTFAIGNVGGKDPDLADIPKLTYTITRADSPDHIGINPTTGAMFVKVAAINYEVKKSYIYEVTVSDGVNKVPTNVIITVLDQNDPPVFTSTNALVVKENAVGGTAVRATIGGSKVGMSATDEDGEAVTFQIDCPAFTVAANGEVSVVSGASLDFETKSSYACTATARDARQATTTMPITINLIDENEAPVFRGSCPASLSVAENSLQGTAVGTTPVGAADPDAGQVVTYTLSALSPDTQPNLFSVDALTGQVRVSSGKLEYEPGPRSYSMKVTATDSGIPTRLFSECVVNVAVTDVDEPPVFMTAANGGVYTFTVNENSIVGATVGTPATNLASDPEGLTVTYSLIGAPAFTVDSATGQISVAAAVLDFETQNTYSATLIAKDPGNNMATQVITIKLNDVQEPPLFNRAAPIVITAQEETPQNAYIGQPITATDPDKGQTVTYSVVPVNPANNYVSIDPSTGMLKVSAAALPSASAISLFSVTVTATDSFNPPGATSIQVDVNVTVAKIKNKAPNVQSNIIFNVPESTAVGTVIGDASNYAVDPDNDVDAGRLDALTFQLGNNNPIPFAVASDGKITLNSVLDFEAMLWGSNTYSIVISVTDSPPMINGTQLVSLTTVRTWTIVIKDVNEPCTLAPASVRLTENVAVGTAVMDGNNANLILRAVDQDYHTPNWNETVKYAITGGNINKAFGLVALNDATTPTSGAGQLEGVKLVTAGAINFEKLASYALDVTATDLRGLTCIGKVTVSIDDANDAPTLVQPPPLEVAESTIVGAALGGPYSANDEDSDSLSWQITAGNTGNVFAVSPSGQLMLVAPVDYETVPSYSLTITVNDGRGGTATRVHQVNIGDVNEPPVWTANSTASINENSPQGTVVFTAKCYDQDFGEVLTYSITGGNTDSALVINANTGAVSINTAAYFNFEVNAAISPQIACTDRKGAVAKQVVKVTINNLNEKPQLQVTTLYVVENSPAGTATTLPLAWFDEDVGDTLSVSIVSGNTGSSGPLFTLVTNDTTITPGSKPYIYTNSALFDYEGKKAPSKYTLTLNITDNGTPQMFLVTQVTIASSDVNEAPVFLAQARSVPENSPKNAFAGAPLVATDEDAGQSVYFAIVSGNDLGFFKIDACSGQISVANTGLDFEANPAQYPFYLTITATDDAGSSPGPARLSATAVVTITISDVNEPPTVNDMAVTVAENSPVGFKIADIGGADPDVLSVNPAWRTLVFALVSNPSQAFAINATNGVISVGKVKPWDFESPDGNVLTAVISVADAGGLAGTKLAKLTCTITDINEPPIIPTSPRQLRLQRESTLMPFNGLQSGSLIGQRLDAYDPDDGQTARLSWALISSAPPAAAVSWFAVDATGPTAGQLSLTSLGAANGVLDFESYPKIDLLMRVTDEFGLYDEQNITVSLVDLNENPFVWQPQTLSVLENSPVNSRVGSPINTTDPEKTALTYTMVSVTGPQGMFTIDSGSGQIRVLDPTNLDYEAPVNTFTAVIEVEDMGTLRDGSPAGAKLAGRGDVTINILNVNEPPVIQPCVLTVPENSPVGTLVGIAAYPNCVSDPDGPEDALTAVFTIVSQDKTYKNEANPFSVDPVSGNITVAAVNGQRPDLNYEKQRSFTVMLKATDAGGLSSKVAAITIKLSNVNEPPRWKTIPKFYAEDSVDQNVGMPLINFVEDEDMDVASTGEEMEIWFAYYNAGNTGGTFSLDVHTGQLAAPLTVNPYLIRGTIFNLTIQVFDKGVDGPMYNDTTIVQVFVTDGNKAPFLGNRVGGYVSLFIPENVAEGYILDRNINGTDPNNGQQITYSMLPSLNNANRPWPFVITTLPNRANVGGLCVPNGPTTCGIIANPSGLGQISVKFEPGAMSIDYEAPEKAAAKNDGSVGFRVYDAQVTGTDDHETHMQMTVPIKIFVKDMPEAPYFTNTRIPNTGVIIMSVPENSATGVAASVVASMSTMGASPEGGIFAMDEDTGEGHGTPQHAYSFVGSPPGLNFFSIDSKTGVITVSASGAVAGVLNWEATKEFNFTVKVVDKTGRSDTALLRMQLADVNEVPFFVGSGLLDSTGTAIAAGSGLTVKENARSGTAIGRVVADDFDSKTIPWGTLTYSLQQDDEALPFDINPTTGAVTVTKDATNAALLDWEDKRRWTPTVVVTDGGDLFVKKMVTIDVLDVADSVITGFSVSPADEAAGKAVTVRTSPIYAVSHLGMDVLFITEGSVNVMIAGTGFGPTAASLTRDGANAATTVITATYGPSGVEFTATNCAVTTPNTVVTCKTTAAVGPNHVWKLIITYTGANLPSNALSGTSNAVASGTALTGVLKPVVDKIYVTDLTSAQEFKTNGGADIFLEGSNFGANAEIILFYGPVTGREYKSPSCVYVTDHKKIKCTSAPGVGGKLTFSLQIGPSPLQMAPAPDTLIRYSTPLISILTAPRLDTAGGDVVKVVGENFGPAGSLLSLICSSDLAAPSGVPVFTATKCTIINHETADCVTSPGIGANLKCRASVGGQTSVASTAQLHYNIPQVMKISGVGASTASTRGGQQLIISGSQLGPTTVLDAVGAIVKVSDFITVKYGPLGVPGVPLTLNGAMADAAAAFLALRFIATDCYVSSAHTQIVCFTAEGVGKDLYSQVSVGGQHSPLFANFTMSFARPVISVFTGAGSNRADTRGSESVVISGDMFGPLDTPIDSVFYGPTGTEFEAKNCSITIAHTQIKCLSALGAGKDHTWLISIGMQFSVAPTTNYAPPMIIDISGPGARDASTAGGQEVIITGNFFAVQKYLDRITYGKTGTEYKPLSCTVLSHSSISCLTAPGTGRKLKWIVTVAGQSSPLSSVTTSYAAPVLSLVTPATGRTIGSTAVAPNGAKILAPITLTGKNLASSALGSVVQVKMNAIGLTTPTAAEIQAYYDQVDAGDFPSDAVARWIEALVTLTPTARGSAGGEETITFNLPEGWGKGRELFVLVDGVPSNMLTFSYNSPSLMNVAPDRVGVPLGFLRVFMDGDSFCSGRDSCGSIFVDGTEYQPMNYSHTQVSFAVPQPSSSTPAKASICWRASNGKPKLCSQELSFKSPVPNFNGLVGQNGWYDMSTKGGEEFFINGVRDIGTIPQDQISMYFADANRRWDCPKGTVTKTPQGDVCPPELDRTSPSFESCRTYKLSCPTPAGVGAKLYIYISTPGGDSRADEGFTFSYSTPKFSSMRLTQGGFPSAAANASRTDGGAFVITPTGQLSSAGLLGSFVTPPTVPFLGSMGSVPTTGGVLVFSGSNLGSARMDSMIRLTTPDGPPGDLTIIGHNHTAMIAALPAGDGANRKIVLTVGFQDSNQYVFNYKAPTVTSVSPASGPTAGGTILTIKGSDFGVSMPVIKIGGIVCPLAAPYAPTTARPFFVPSPNHDTLACVLPAGSGAGLPVVVTVNGQSSPVDNVAKFAYTPSHVSSIWPANGPTSGRFPAKTPAVTGAIAGSLAANLAIRIADASITPGDRVNITLRGTDFGSSGTIRFLADPELFGSDPLAPPAQIVPDSHIISWNDTTILFSLPAGYGFNLSVNVATPKITMPFSQNGDSDAKFDYNPPTISAVVHAEFASKEDSCQRSWKRIKVYEDVAKRNMTTRYSWYYPRCYPNKGGEKIMVVGDSLGMGGATTSEGGSGVSVTIGGKPCPIIKATGADAGFASTDNKIFCMLPPGSGYDLPVIAQVGSRSSVPSVLKTAGSRRLAFEASSSPFPPSDPYPSAPDYFSYDPAFIDEVAPNAFTLGTPGKMLSLRGYNFGNEPSNTTLMVNELACDNPTWISADRVECMPQIDVVGAKNVSLLIANHNQPAIRFDVEEKLIYLCRYAFYGLEGEECLPCPTGGVCPGEERFKDMLNSTAGFWRANMSVTTELATQLCEAPRLTTRTEYGCPVLQPCEPVDSCLGNNTCAYGYEGERCAFCLRGKFHRVNGECIKCPGNLVVLYLGLACVLAAAILGAYWLNKKKISLALIAIGVDYFQVVSMFGRAKIKWPPELKELLHLLSVFNLNIDIVAPECLNPGLSYHVKWFFIESLPLLIIGAFAIISVGKIIYKLACTSKRKAQLTAHLPTLVSTSIVVMRLMFLFLCMTAIQAMSCLPTNPIEYRDRSDPKNPKDPIMYMNGMLEYECWKPGGWQLVLFPIGLGLFLLWGIVMPVSGFWWLFKNRETVTYDQVLRLRGLGDDELSNPHYRWRKTWSKLYINFKPQNYFWEFVITGRKFLIALVALLFRQAASYQLAMSLLVLFTAFCIHVNQMPYLTHANRATILDEHHSMVLAGDPMRTRIQTSMDEMEKKNTRKRVKQFAFDGLTDAAKKKDFSAVVLLFIFDPNTVESILLASAILVDLMGVLLDSQWFAGEKLFAHYPEYTAIGIGAVLIILFTVIYYAFVIMLELMHTLCPHRMTPIVGCLGICFKRFSKRQVEEAVIRNNKSARASLSGGAGGVSKRKSLVLTDMEGFESAPTLTLNPFLLKQQSTRTVNTGTSPVVGTSAAAALAASDGSSSSKDGVANGGVMDVNQVGSIDSPTPMMWKAVQGSYATMHSTIANLQNEIRDLKKSLDEARGISETAATSSPNLSRIPRKTTFKPRLMGEDDDAVSPLGSGATGFVAGGGAASLRGFNKLAAAKKSASTRVLGRFAGAEELISDDDSRSTTTAGGTSLRSGALSPASVASAGRQWHAGDAANSYVYAETQNNPIVAASSSHDLKGDSKATPMVSNPLRS